MKLRIETYLRTIVDGKFKEWLSMGKACESEQGESGYASVAEMRRELKNRLRTSHAIVDVENGIETRPNPGCGTGYSRQVITLIE
jgi:hypothetical protein